MILNIIFVIFLNWLTISSAKKLVILMPNVTTNIEDAYMATSYKLEDDDRFITGIQPLTNAHIAYELPNFLVNNIPLLVSVTFSLGDFKQRGKFYSDPKRWVFRYLQILIYFFIS